MNHPATTVAGGRAATIASALSVFAVIDGYRLTGPAKQLLVSAVHDNARFATTVAVFQRPPVVTPLILAALQHGVPVVVLRDRFPGDPRTMMAFVRRARASGADVLQTHGYKANVLAALLRNRIGKPWVAFLHGETFENRKVRAYFRLERAAVRRADRVVAVSRAMADRLVTDGIPPRRVVTLHNACLLADPCAPPATVSAPPTIAVIGRLSPEKGVDVALRAHAIVSRSIPGVRLVVAGEGPDEGNLRKLAADLGVAATVEWRGYVDDPGDVYRRTSILVLPSRSEGLPNVALEAMAHGVPVVGSAVGGVPEVVSDNENGFLVRSEDSAAMAARIVALLSDPSLRRRLGQRAFEGISTRFSVSARVQRLGALYREVAR